MSIFKRGRVYWFHFWFDGRHLQRSTKQGNPRIARQIEAAYRIGLAKGEVGIREQKRIPRFTEGMRDFLAWSMNEHKAHPRTYVRYVTSSAALIRYFKDEKLDRINTDHVERYKTWRSG
jgi:hypothetical protein